MGLASLSMGANGVLYIGDSACQMHDCADADNRPTLYAIGERVPHYVRLRAAPPVVEGGGDLVLSWNCDFNVADYRGVGVDIYVAALREPVTYGIPATLKDLADGGAVYLFGRRMESSYVYDGKVREPTFSNVTFSSETASGSIRFNAPSDPDYAGDYAFAAAFVRRDTGEFVRAGGGTIEVSNPFTLLE